jgi:uncharacterized protein (TIGR02266 family)
MSETKGPESRVAEDRRDSHRIPARFRVRREGSQEAFEEHLGDLSLGGLGWVVPEPVPEGTRLEVYLRLPSEPEELRLSTQVLRVVPQEEEEGVRLKVRFVDVPVRMELAIARYFQQLEQGPPPSGG